MAKIEHDDSKFPAFPYKPYSIQNDFMKALYDSLDKGGVSMLESPTGTGKTLSIICSALQWMLDRKQQVKSETSSKSEKGLENDEPDWMRDFVMNKGSQVEEKKEKTKKFGCGSKKIYGRKNSENTRDFRSRYLDESSQVEKEGNRTLKKNDALELDDEEFLLEEYESEEEALKSEKPKRKGGLNSLSSSSEGENEEDDSDEDVEEGLKIYFCSRTHSQLSQFIKELRKTSFPKEINAVCLGARKIFCINEEVLRLGSSSRINERCLELQKSKKNKVSKIMNLGTEGKVRRTKASSGCPMLRKHRLQKEFKSHISQEGALDIEDLVQLGKGLGTCPYYGSRSMIPAANLVVLPYQSLLSKSSRETLGLNLKNNIVIIDEAHNLADSLISMYDAKITISQLENVHSRIEMYFRRFCNVLGAGNRRYIQTLMVLTRAFLQALNEEHVNHTSGCHDAESGGGKKNTFDSSMAINDFLFSLNIDNINLFKLLQYIKESKIMHKVSGYGDKINDSQKGLPVKGNGEGCESGSTLSGFQSLAEMLSSLTNNDGDGRIIISRKRPGCCGQEGGYLKYIMLTGEKIFSEIVNEAHAVVLAGGTLQPIEETRERLFPWLPADQLHFFSCNHIVPRESILPMAVSRGPSGQTFDFSYNSRSSSTMIQELGLLICNLATVVPEGIVVFLSSYEYERQVYDAWKASGILERIMKKKRIFREPRKSTDVEVILKEYKETIDTLSTVSKEGPSPQNGAILLAVVGGKISEGINFSDGMGRCIVMVGLPYPSPSDIELLERIKHIESLGGCNSTKNLKNSTGDEYYGGDVQTGISILRSCRNRGKEYYENLCMKAVNQSIGRAIRHIKDYAAILLVDTRYASDSSRSCHPSNKLPQWIKDCLVSKTSSYGEVHRLLHQFFKFNKTKD